MVGKEFGGRWKKRGVLEFGGVEKEVLGLRVCVEKKGNAAISVGFRVHGDRVGEF